MNAVIETTAANGLNLLAGQVFKKLYRKYSLPMRMRRDLEDGGSKSPQNILLDSLQLTLGSPKSLTKATSQSLLDLANSGLLDQLILLFGSNLDHSDAIKLVSYIHLSRGSENKSASNKFAEDLKTCLQTAISQFDSSTHEYWPLERSRMYQRDIADAAKKAGSLISTIVNSLTDNEGNWLTEVGVSSDVIAKGIYDHADPIAQYVRNTIQRLNTVDVHGPSGDVIHVPLDDIYVDVPVNFIDRKRGFIAYQELRTHLPRREIADNWNETLEYISKTVLLGDPGGGKSTLSRKLCCECGKLFLKGHSTFPIFIQLRTYIAKAGDDEDYSLVRYILDHVSSGILDSEYSIETTILYFLRIGSAFVVADGLDEVLTPSNRARVVKEINNFSKEFPLTSLLVTSRYVGYENHPLNDFNHFGVDNLNTRAI